MYLGEAPSRAEQKLWQRASRLSPIVGHQTVFCPYETRWATLVIRTAYFSLLFHVQKGCPLPTVPPRSAVVQILRRRKGFIEDRKLRVSGTGSSLYVNARRQVTVRLAGGMRFESAPFRLMQLPSL